MTQALTRLLQRVGCFFGFHGGVLFRPIMRGQTRLALYQCKRCRRRFTEKF